MASVNLPETVDTTYADDGADATVKLHQQYHDAEAKVVNRFDYDLILSAATNQIMAKLASGLWGPTAGTSALIPTTVFELTPGGNYTFVLADAGKLKGSLTTDTAALTYTLPLNATTAFPLGSTFVALQRGTGQITIAGETSAVTFLYDGAGPKTAQQGAGITLIKLFADQWWVRGGIN